MDEPLHCLVEIPNKQPEGKEVLVDGGYERALALRLIDESRDRRQETRS